MRVSTIRPRYTTSVMFLRSVALWACYLLSYTSAFCYLYKLHLNSFPHWVLSFALILESCRVYSVPVLFRPLELVIPACISSSDTVWPEHTHIANRSSVRRSRPPTVDHQAHLSPLTECWKHMKGLCLKLYKCTLCHMQFWGGSWRKVPMIPYGYWLLVII